MTGSAEHLRSALADRYTIERELGRGGMAVVYLARDLKHDRQVAIKVLTAQVAEGVKTERFTREIQLAGKLSHTNILPLYDSGDAGGALFYVMPYVAGESLRDRLDLEKRLSLEAAVQITREVAEALSYAHAHGVVHRDIKPENILLQSGHAVVMDFGIARALSAAQGQTVTQTGTMVGTPLYMSPEQASGTAVDGRSDVYSLGCVLYEMLAGHPPFSGQNTQEVLARHLMDPVPSLKAARAAVPDSVERAIQKALAKQAEDRFATASQFAEVLGAPSQEDREAATGANRPLRIAALFGLAAIGVLSVVYFLVTQLGLPDWVLPGAVVLLLIGLPITLATGVVERRRALAPVDGSISGALGGAVRWLTWRKTILGGGAAFAGLGVLTAGYMAMRLLGIGPVGTLVAAGVLDDGGRVILADFTDRTGDSALATTFTEAFRVDLGQSRTIRLLEQADVGEVLRRMQRDPGSKLTPLLARELATREGLKAIVVGDIGPAGGGFLLSSQLLDAVSGKVIVAFREAARDSTEIIDAMDRLSKRLRKRVGESLKSVRNAPALARVTTGSLPALRKYSEGFRAAQGGDFSAAIRLYREAITLDTSFTAAYGALGGRLAALGLERDAAVRAFARAYANRDRLPDTERLGVVSSYHQYVTGDAAAALDANRQLLEIDSLGSSRLNGAGNPLWVLRRYPEAVAYFERATRAPPPSVIPRSNLVRTLLDAGDLAGAEVALRHYRETMPDVSTRWLTEARVAVVGGRYDSAQTFLVRMRERFPGSTRDALIGLMRLATIRGRLREEGGYGRELVRLDDTLGRPAEALKWRAEMAQRSIEFGGSVNDRVADVENALARSPLERLPPLDRPYVSVAMLYLRAHRPARTKDLLDAYDRAVPDEWRGGEFGGLSSEAVYLRARGWLALEERRFEEAIGLFRQADRGRCRVCGLPDLGRAYQLAGLTDSAIAQYERYAAAPPTFQYEAFTAVPLVYQSLAAVYEERGDRSKALEYYGRFVDLWKNADPELQPVVRDVRARIARLTGER